MRYTYLALGDSYTIGEAVPIYESFPYQAVQILRGAGYDFYAPEIIARTGWATDELQQGIGNTKFLNGYDFVSLLIGVNNQYRGRDTAIYMQEFAALLKQAINFAGGNRKKVFVLSVPDWGVTPFAEGRDRKQISREIDAYNEAAENIARENDVHFINITPGTREAANDKTLLATDHLHPSGKEYARWANQLAAAMIKVIK
jgi:lysophospholipase L1-like esterase